MTSYFLWLVPQTMKHSKEITCTESSLDVCGSTDAIKSNKRKNEQSRNSWCPQISALQYFVFTLCSEKSITTTKCIIEYYNMKHDK